MSEQGGPPAEVGGVLGAVILDDGVGTFWAADTYTTEDMSVTLAQWTEDDDIRLGLYKSKLDPADYAVLVNVDTVVRQGLADGFMPPSQVGPFFRWMWLEQGTEDITPAMVANGQLYTYMYVYGAEQGVLAPGATPPAALAGPPPGSPTGAIAPPGTPMVYPATTSNPAAPTPKPAPVTYPQAPPPAAPTTPAGTIVKEVINKTTVVQVSDARLSADVADAVSKAMQAETQFVTQLVVRTVDQALGGLNPGQAKIAIQRLNNVDQQVIAQVQAIGDIVSTIDMAAVEADIAAINLTDTAQQAQIDKLISQMDLTVPSALDTHVNTIGDQVATNKADIATIVGTSIPLLAEATQNLTSVVGGIDSKLTNDVEPELSTLKTDVTANSAKLALTTDDCLAQLCDAENNVTNPIKSGGATPSLLRSLGGLLGRAFEIGFLATLADTLVTLLDAKLSVSAMVSDVETISGWATTAAGTVEADLGQLGPLGA